MAITTASVGWDVRWASAPRHEQAVGGVGRWGRMTGTRGRLIAHGSWLMADSSWVILLRKGWEETADGVGRGWVRVDGRKVCKTLVG